MAQKDPTRGPNIDIPQRTKQHKGLKMTTKLGRNRKQKSKKIKNKYKLFTFTSIYLKLLFDYIPAPKIEHLCLR